MWRLAQGAVDANSPYAYLMMCEFYGDTCAVGTVDGQPVAFVTGFRLPADAETLFIWQIATSDAARGRGIGSQMLDELVDRPSVPRVRFLEATVTPGNEASLRLFRGFAKRRDAACHEESLFLSSDFPEPHEPEHRLRIGPF